MIPIVLASVSLAGAQEVSPDRYRAKFGAEEDAVKKTASSVDDLQFSAKVLQAARAAYPAAYRSQLYEKVYELSGKRTGGYKQAIEALNYLVKAVPSRRAEWLDKKLQTLTKKYLGSYGTGKAMIAETYLQTMLEVGENKAKGGSVIEAEAIYKRAYALAVQTKSPLKSEIRDKVAELTAAASLEKKTAQFKRAFAAKPSLRNRHNLIFHYFADLNLPAEAVALVNDEVDTTLAVNLSMAASPAGELKSASCLQMAKWCESLAKKPISTKGKLNVYRRARDYYGRYLNLGDITLAEQARARLAIARLDKLIDKMDPSGLTIDCGGGVKMKLKRLKAGKFTIGSPATEKNRGSDEGPQTVIELARPFYIGLTEVNQAQYEAVMGASANASSVKGPTLPVTGVRPSSAMAFCKKLSATTSRTVRLPTEAEWEYACRAGSKAAYCFGDDPTALDAYAWTSKNSAVSRRLQPHAGATRKANAWGLYDMHGNVRELVITPYSSSSYSGAASKASQDPAACRSTLQARGGSAGRDLSFCRSSNRAAASTRGDSLTGFRVVIELTKSPVK